VRERTFLETIDCGKLKDPAHPSAYCLFLAHIHIFTFILLTPYKLTRCLEYLADKIPKRQFIWRSLYPSPFTLSHPTYDNQSSSFFLSPPSFLLLPFSSVPITLPPQTTVSRTPVYLFPHTSSATTLIINPPPSPPAENNLESHTMHFCRLLRQPHSNTSLPLCLALLRLFMLDVRAEGLVVCHFCCGGDEVDWTGFGGMEVEFRHVYYW
jgi:hypothetical protein